MSARLANAPGPDPDERTYRLVVLLWVLYLLAPAKVVTYYIPSLRPLSWAPELLLFWCTWVYLRSPRKGPGFPAFTAFLWLIIFGTGVAAVIGNWGVSRELLRLFYQYWLLGIVTLTFCNTPRRARAILTVYFFYFLYYGIWGLISLKLSPLAANVDPGARVIVGWHPNFENRDAFGPLMVAGLVYSIYYYRATQTTASRNQKVVIILGILLSGVGFVTSFGRGAFLAFLVTAASMWARARRKLAILIAASAAVGVLAFAAPQVTQRYLASMQTITEQGMHEGTGEDRKYLWAIAWREFLSSPIVGVGTANYGVAAQWVLGAQEQVGPRYTRAKLWGRATHSAPMTILSEYGLLGVLIASFIVWDFFRTNRRIRKAPKAPEVTQNALPPGYVEAVALGLNGAFLAYCVSGIFYEVLYTPLIWNVIVLNRMLYCAVLHVEREQPRPGSHAARQ